jgi:hypothetical protein
MSSTPKEEVEEVIIQQNVEVISNDTINWEVLYQILNSSSPTLIKKTIQEKLVLFFEQSKKKKEKINQKTNQIQKQLQKF